VLEEMLVTGNNYAHVKARRLVWLSAAQPLLKVIFLYCLVIVRDICVFQRSPVHLNIRRLLYLFFVMSFLIEYSAMRRLFCLCSVLFFSWIEYSNYDASAIESEK
jgi:hypothetical protein